MALLNTNTHEYFLLNTKENNVDLSFEGQSVTLETGALITYDKEENTYSVVYELGQNEYSNTASELPADASEFDTNAHTLFKSLVESDSNKSLQLDFKELQDNIVSIMKFDTTKHEQDYYQVKVTVSAYNSTDKYSKKRSMVLATKINKNIIDIDRGVIINRFEELKAITNKQKQKEEARKQELKELHEAAVQRDLNEVNEKEYNETKQKDMATMDSVRAAFANILPK